MCDVDAGLPDLLATARFHDPMSLDEVPSSEDIDAVYLLQDALKALGQLCIDVMSHGSGAWARTGAELEKAAQVCRDRSRPELPPACRAERKALRPVDPDRTPIYETQAAS
jgi:hypothetical protein